MTISRLVAALLLCCCCAMGQQPPVTVPGEPTNIQTVKDQLKHYHDCTEADCYMPQMERQVDLAIKYMKHDVAAAKPGEKLAIVFDIDETVLSNWSTEVHDDFAYVPADWNLCVQLWCGRAILPTLRLFKEAEKDKVAVFFITGRPETQRNDTATNLRAEGFDQWVGLYLRPVNHPASQAVDEYKSGDRADILGKGYRIVVNVGDQMSDLTHAPLAEHSVKLPNPFYFIP